MNALSFSSLLIIISTFAMMVFLLIKGKGKKVSIIWGLLCIALFIWGITGFKISLTTSKKQAYLLWQIGYIGIVFIPPLFFHFICSVLKLKKNLLLLIVYTTAILFVLINILIKEFFLGELKFVFNQFFWVSCTFLFLCYYIGFCIILLSYSYILLIVHFRNAKGLQREQLKYFLLGASIAWIGGCGNYLLTLGVNIYPYSNFLIAIYPVIIAYAIIKHELLDIKIVITRTAIFTLVYGFTFGLPFVLFFFYGENLHSLYHSVYQSFPWGVPLSIMAYAALATITPFVYLKLERKAYYTFFGDYTSQLQILTETSREIVEKGFENALELAESIPNHVANFYEIVMQQRLRHVFYILKKDNHFTIHHGKNKCPRLSDKHSDKRLTNIKLAQENPIVKWFTQTKNQLAEKGLAINKKNPLLRKDALDFLIDKVSRKEKFKEFKEELINLRDEIIKVDVVYLLPCYYKDELMGILALGDKKEGFYQPEEINALQKFCENTAMVFKGSQLAIAAMETEKLKELEKAKSELFANVSHGLRTPLTIIISTIQGVLDRIGDKITPENKEEKQVLLGNAYILLKLVNELLDISKLESGKMKIQAELIDINSLLEESITLVSPSAKNDEIEIDFLPDPCLSSVYVDFKKINNVFSNLIGNALKFSKSEGDKKGKIAIITKEAKDYIEISVSDNGIGIPDEHIKNLFTRFYQVDSSSSRKFEGTGIGLFLVKQFVELHHGDVIVESTVGEGTSFVVRLLKGKGHLTQEEIIQDDIKKEGGEKKEGPFVEQRTGLDDRRKDNIEDKITINCLHLQYSDIISQNNKIEFKEKEGGNEEMYNILVVEDNKQLANHVGNSLSKSYNIAIANNGKEGLEKVYQKMPDIIVSDVMMPEMDGWELCEKIKTDERMSHIPFILLTARTDEKDKIAGLNLGADYYLPKPYNTRELEAVIHSLIMNREYQAQLNKVNHELKKALQELREAQVQLVRTARLESVGQLAAGVAHEIKNKMYCLRAGLAGIDKRLVMLSEGKLDPKDTYKNMLTAIKTNNDAVEQALFIVNSLLDFSRKEKSVIDKFDINHGIENALNMLSPVIKDKVFINKEYNELSKIACNIEEINQVITNILINAYQAIKNKGTVWIKTSQTDDTIAISIRDNGPGIAMENLEKIFDPFFTTKGPQGTGLGLSICYRIVKEHQGEIRVESKEGEGAEFIITLPVKQVEGEEVRLPAEIRERNMGYGETVRS
ncbi:MAG: ATP-binding protein [bacterium]